jgi:hypothetical protein
MRFLGALAKPQIDGVAPLPGRSNYLIGNSPEQWTTDVGHFGRVAYRDLYPGIDLVFHGEQGNLEYDFVVAPGADPGVIGLGLEGPGRLEIDSNDNLIMRWPGGEVAQRPPEVYQEVEGARESIPGRFILEGGSQVRFEVGDHDTARPLVIDPVLSYSSYMGGSSNDSVRGVAVDSLGSVYLVGTTGSIDFPTAGAPLQSSPSGSSSLFVAKLNAAGSALIYSTFLGGSGQDIGGGISLDAVGNVFVTGQTDSTDFPTANAAQESFAGGLDAFVAKLNTSGSALLYSTYLGGGGSDTPYAIDLDSSFSAYLIGWTDSSDFPTVAAAQGEFGGGNSDAFVARLNAGGSGLVYATYLGGSGAETDNGSAISVGPSSIAHVTGDTDSGDFPTANALQPESGGLSDAFVTKLGAAGTTLYSTYLGGLGDDGGRGIAVNPAGEIYITGATNSLDFPTVDALQASKSGNLDSFLAKMNASGSSLIFSTFLGGNSADRGVALGLDQSGVPHFLGNTVSTDFPTHKAVQEGNAGGLDAFAAALDASGAALLYSTYLGGTGSDIPETIAAHGSGVVFAAGVTLSTDFPTARPLQSSNAGFQDGFITKLFAPMDFWIAAAGAPVSLALSDVGGPR